VSERIATSLIPRVGAGFGVALVSGLGDALAGEGDGEAEPLGLALGRGDSRCSKTGPNDALALGDGVGIGGGEGAPAVGVGKGMSNCVGPFGARGTGISDGDGLGLGEELADGLAFGLALSLGAGEGLVTCATVSGACVAHDCEPSRSSARFESADDESAAAEAADAGRVCPRTSTRATNVASHARAGAIRINLTGLLER
jgi:hypothetical protein